MKKTLCYTYDLERARKAFSKVPQKIKSKSWNLYYSRLGGDSVRVGMEWMQHQWQKNLGVKVQLKPTENGAMLENLKQNKMDIFRKGMYLSRPTCLAALENFKSDSQENFIGFKHKKYDKNISVMNNPKVKFDEKLLCYATFKMLFDSHKLIPLGEIHFSMIKDQKFSNWSVNSLNQLDLSQIKAN